MPRLLRRDHVAARARGRRSSRRQCEGLAPPSEQHRLCDGGPANAERLRPALRNMWRSRRRLSGDRGDFLRAAPRRSSRDRRTARAAAAQQGDLRSARLTATVFCRQVVTVTSRRGLRLPALRALSADPRRSRDRSRLAPRSSCPIPTAPERRREAKGGRDAGAGRASRRRGRRAGRHGPRTERATTAASTRDRRTPIAGQRHPAAELQRTSAL